MEFYLELTDLLQSYRLQTDGSWRKVACGNREILDSDFLCAHVFELIRLQKNNTSLELNGTVYNIKREIGNDRRIIYYDVFVKREIFPFTPSKEQLRSVINQGDDRINNSLILNVYGFFEVRDFHTMDINTDDPTLVFRYETFGAGNGYVGAESADDNGFIDDLYALFLLGWYNHLVSGATNMYFEKEATESEQEIINKINSLSDRWTYTVED